ncbi:RNA polymerase sigma factor SigF [Nocardia sp. 2]|uniref:RNA polymerase sigma factor SigF n=1 Tax=Nocardia acididurans TaxID=2802282 RepID=A0ABS1M6X7_9NOCA|nr:RNA polymerase sigma factor SigF [Nocardia acididurans]MBL1076402.1 RNA polymerase sigma factor SigF [Nocardia acididurans]
MSEANTVAGTRQGRKAAHSYDAIEPLFREREELPADDPRRESMRDQIIECCLPLAEHIARRFAGRGEAFDDLLQIARMGLVQAVDRFDVTRGATFLSFAVPTIMGEVRRHFRDHTWAVRVPRRAKELQQQLGPVTEKLSQRLGRMPTAREIAVELDVDLVEVTQAMIARNAYQASSLDYTGDDGESEAAPVVQSLGAEEPSYRLLEDAMAVRPLLAALPARERQILIWRFFENRTQAQIGERLGVSQMQVSRLLTKTLTTLREQALAEPAPQARIA